jgi:hypothetical protein
LDLLTGPQLNEWEAYDKIDPIGTWREDFRGAKLESLIINIVQQLYAKKGHSPVITTAAEFMPDWTGGKKVEPKKQSVEEMKSILMSFAKKQNKSVKGIHPPIRKPDKYQGQ